MTHNLTCQGCGTPFEAKRSDAKFHNAACRQAHYRRVHDPVASPVRRVKTTDRTKLRAAEERLSRIAGLGVDWHLEEALRHANVPHAVANAADETLAAWQKKLTNTIRLLSKVRQAVRAEQASRRQA